MMWIDKYAPQTIDEIIGNSLLVSKLAPLCRPVSDASSGGVVHFPHMILYGPAGVGKSSIVRMLVAAQLGEHSSTALLNFDSTDDRCIQNVRDRICQFVPRKVPDGKKKMVIFEQADQLGDGVQQLMRTLMEKYAKHTVFVFVCDKLHGVIETVQSRSMVYQMKQIETEDMVAHEQRILRAEGVTDVSDDVCRTIAVLTNGDVRQCVNYLQTCVAATAPAPLTLQTVNDVCVFPHLQTVSLIMEAIFAADALSAFGHLVELHTSGYTAVDVIMCLSTHMLMHPISCEATHLGLMKEIAIAHTRVTKGVDSALQLCGMVARMIRRASRQTES
jgi:replication factor C subunit 2/4